MSQKRLLEGRPSSVCVGLCNLGKLSTQRKGSAEFSELLMDALEVSDVHLLDLLHSLEESLRLADRVTVAPELFKDSPLPLEKCLACLDVLLGLEQVIDKRLTIHS